jgi:hypothetical protein
LKIGFAANMCVLRWETKASVRETSARERDTRARVCDTKARVRETGARERETKARVRETRARVCETKARVCDINIASLRFSPAFGSVAFLFFVHFTMPPIEWSMAQPKEFFNSAAKAFAGSTIVAAAFGALGAAAFGAGVSSVVITMMSGNQSQRLISGNIPYPTNHSASIQGIFHTQPITAPQFRKYSIANKARGCGLWRRRLLRGHHHDVR